MTLEHNMYSTNGQFTITISVWKSCMEMEAGYLMQSFLLKCVC